MDFFEYKKVENKYKIGELTEKEANVLDYTMAVLSTWEPESEPGYSNLEVEEVGEVLHIGMKVLRGVLGSLSKKGYIEVHEMDVGFGDTPMIYVTDKTRELY